MAGAASAHQAATASREQNSQQRAVRTRRTTADPQRAQQGATAAAAAAPAALDSLSRLQQLADASPQVAQLRRLQALADGHYAPVAQFAGDPEEEERVQGKFASAQLPPQLQQAPRANNTGLSDQFKSGIESLSGFSMDHVWVDYNSSQPAQLNALASAQGSDIHLAPGQGRHLPHQARHVVQQAQGPVKPTRQMKRGVAVNDEAGFECEADLIGARAMQLVGERIAQLSAGENGGQGERSGQTEVAMSPGTVQLRRRRQQLSPAAQANRQRLLDKQSRRYAAQNRQHQAEQEFHTMIGTDGLDQHKYPLDNFAKGKESIGEAMERLPSGMRRSSSLRDIVSLPDAAHGQEDEARTEVSKGEFQEALAGWHFSKLAGLSEVRSKSAQIDFAGTNSEGREVPFDPFMSPLAAEGRDPNPNFSTAWAQSNNHGSYYKHTHAKGGDENTVGVWDQTYSSKAQVSHLKALLATSGADRDARVHELRVPIAEGIAREHIAAEAQIQHRTEREVAKRKQWAEARKRYDKAQRRKPAERRMSFEEALIENSDLGRYWRTQV